MNKAAKINELEEPRADLPKSGVFETNAKGREAYDSELAEIDQMLNNFHATQLESYLPAAKEKRGVMEKLRHALLGRKSVVSALVYATVGIAVTGTAKHKIEEMSAELERRQEAAEDFGVAQQVRQESNTVEKIDLDKLHPGMSKENVQRLLRTYPKGWLRNVEEIKFDPNAYPMDEKLDAKVLGFNVRGGGQDAITFTAFSGYDPRQAIEESGPHEIAHSNDWSSPSELNEAEREEWRGEASTRATAADRVESDYADAVVKDAARHRTEYWAEALKIYFKSANPEQELAQGDLNMIEKRIRALDPNFDAVAMAHERRDVLDQIFAENYLRSLETYTEKLAKGIVINGMKVPTDPDLKDNLKNAWMTWRYAETPTRAAEGRLEMAEFWQKWSGNAGTKMVAEELISRHRWLEHLAKEISDGVFDKPKQKAYLDSAVLDAEKLIEARYGKDAPDVETIAKVKAEFDELTARHGIIMDTYLQPGEYEKLLDTRPGKVPDEFIGQAGFHIPKADRKLAAYVGAHSFENIDAAKRSVGTL
jgi:hypothetical protein